jgi:hypothetical protein
MKSGSTWVKVSLILLLLGVKAQALGQSAAQVKKLLNCDGVISGLCTERYDNVNYEGHYTGHDEPSLLFYSDVPGSGNSSIYRITLPMDPPTPPNQLGTGGTFSFQLHFAFWFGMAMCDTQSAPNFTHTCEPDSDENIFDDANPHSAKYIGRHPGTAFMEMQFYPPGNIFNPSCDPTHYCAALNIDSLNRNQNADPNGKPDLFHNNVDCLNKVGEEPLNFAYITASGVAGVPADPITGFGTQVTHIPADVLLMNPGDILIVTLRDTDEGFRVDILDTNTGQSGSMTASISNGFAQVVFDPSATTCTENPYAFHPMYSTSSEHTRVPWAAHSFNIAFSDEIGHFEFCNSTLDANGNFNEGGSCTVAGVNDPKGLDADDQFCVDPFFPALFGLPAIGYCAGTEFDFDGVPYTAAWPGTNPDPTADSSLHSTPILFTSPLFKPKDEEELRDYRRVAFETDLPLIEFAISPPCNLTTGAGCVNPPPGAFYPFYSTTASNGQCEWQLGGANIPGTKNDFGRSSTAEYGPLLHLTFPAFGGPIQAFLDFRRVLKKNPCKVHSDDSKD